MTTVASDPTHDGKRDVQEDEDFSPNGAECEPQEKPDQRERDRHDERES